jgi:ATP-dependent Clp protease ATP-binding subunit ClpB
MLRGLKSKYEVHHGVTISDSAIITAVTYSNRYISDRQLPDKAIDLMDEAASALRLARESKPDELEALERQITTLQIELSSLSSDQDEVSKARRDVVQSEIELLQEAAQAMEETWRAERERGEEIRRAREELERRKWELEEAVRLNQFDRASELRYAIIPKLEKLLPEHDEAAEGGVRVTSEDVARVVAKVRLVLYSKLAI